MAQETAQSSLQQKVSLAMLAVMVVLAALSYGVLNSVIAPAFENLEDEEARTDLVRAERALSAEILSLSQLALDWAPWDDAYTFVKGENPGFERSNLLKQTLVDLRLNLMLFYREDGSLHWGRLVVGDEVLPITDTGVFGTGGDLESNLKIHNTTTSQQRGLVDSALGPMLVTSNPILTTDSLGPSAGTLILGRLMDDQMLAEMRERTEVDFAWYPCDEHDSMHGSLTEEVGSESLGGMAIRRTESSIDTHSILFDVNGEALLVLEAKTPRRISALGAQTLNAALLFLIIASIVAATLIWLLLRYSIVQPVQALTNHISSLRESGDLTKQVDMNRDDEIGVLASRFDEMTSELDDARKLLLEQSFKAGKADNAAEILHNIRNAMTPVINGIDRLGIVCSVTNGLKVEQATEQLRDPDCDPERREKLLQYVDSAFQHVVASHEEGDRELKAVSSQARQVEAILKDQEKHAHAGPVTEMLDLDEMVDEAVLVIPKRKKPKINLKIEDEVAGLRVEAHRVGLLQVLGNLVLNAYESIQRSAAEAGSISVTASSESIDDKDMVRLVVSDTGCGFDDEQKKKIFQRGYSSKDGHMSGLGLHWCANALAGMGGRIQAQSTGVGEGAEFHVLLPAAHGG